MSCLNYGSRKYVSNTSMQNPMRFDDVAYNRLPSMTATNGNPSNSNGSNNDDWLNSACQSSAYPGTNFVPCGSGGNFVETSGFSSCCVTSWDQNNKSKCCDPVANNMQNDAVACDPSWCPWSAACINDPITMKTCQANPTNTDCLSYCQNFITNINNAPEWCNTFIPLYCQAKSANSQQLSTQDSLLCACLTNQTSADECLLDACVNAPFQSAWLTPTQLKNQHDSSYCGQQCKNIAQAVANETSPINSVTYQKLCSEVPLPQSTVPQDQLPSNNPPSSKWDFSWHGLQTFFSSITTTEWIIFGVICFIIIIILIVRRLMKYTKE